MQSTRDAGRSLVQSGTTDGSGSVSLRFTVKNSGTYLVTAVGPGQHATTSVSVSRCSHDH
jgi:hypothetical protein